MTLAITPGPIDAWHDLPLEEWSLLGWPKDAVHTVCGQRAVMLCATWESASYECCGTPTEEWSMYGPVRCGTFEVVREAQQLPDPARGPDRYSTPSGWSR